MRYTISIQTDAEPDVFGRLFTDLTRTLREGDIPASMFVHIDFEETDDEAIFDEVEVDFTGATTHHHMREDGQTYTHSHDRGHVGHGHGTMTFIGVEEDAAA